MDNGSIIQPVFEAVKQQVLGEVGAVILAAGAIFGVMLLVRVGKRIFNRLSS